MSTSGTVCSVSPRPRIGLALSGGGFRASIFHLGVIRRLEELGIMQDVSVISTVSGGSIVGAYYVLEMERRLRARRKEIQERIRAGGGLSPHAIVADVRLELFQAIEKSFFDALDDNLRSRALAFGPMYHPLLFLKSLWPTCSRSDIIQREYDRVFYDFHPLDQLPSVTDGQPCADFLDGPRLVINATSLLTGERVGFSRVPVSGVAEMNKPNTNVLRISSVVGASSGVPGLFPPTPIHGDLLVDGGVSDNQGLDGLLDDGRWPAAAAISDDNAADVLRDARDYDVILVSDASGQMEPIHRLSASASAVLPRTFSIFQHELRNKTVRRLMAWRRGEEWKGSPRASTSNPGAPSSGGPGSVGPSGRAREFAYVHLYLNLKERSSTSTDERYRVTHRVPSEYVQALARIRTDLDQFSFVEREALLFHGYTTIDAQIRKWCVGTAEHYRTVRSDPPPLRTPPLFADTAAAKQAETAAPAKGSVDRRVVLQELRAGSQAVFLFRTARKFPVAMAVVSALTFFLPWIGVVYWLLTAELVDRIGNEVGPSLIRWWDSCAPWLVRKPVEWIGTALQFPFSPKGVFVVFVLVVATYVLLWLTFVVTRAVALYRDSERYHTLTGVKPRSAWR